MAARHWRIATDLRPHPPYPFRSAAAHPVPAPLADHPNSSAPSIGAVGAWLLFLVSHPRTFFSIGPRRPPIFATRRQDPIRRPGSGAARTARQPFHVAGGDCARTSRAASHGRRSCQDGHGASYLPRGAAGPTSRCGPHCQAQYSFARGPSEAGQPRDSCIVESGLDLSSIV